MTTRARRAPQHLICTKPKPGACKKCRAYILVAVCHGEPVRIDPVHVSLKGEAIALISGAQTFQAGDTRDGTARLRSVEMIRRGLPATAYIHPAHRCGMTYEGEAVDSRNLWSIPAHFLGAVPPF